MNPKIHTLLNQSLIFGAVSPETIAWAERELNVIFPKQYRDFLARYGATIGEGCEIYGLPEQQDDEYPLWRHIVTVTQKLRQLQQIGTENPYFIPLSDNGMDTYYFLNTQYFDKTEIWAISPDRQSLIATDLYDFIEQASHHT